MDAAIIDILGLGSYVFLSGLVAAGLFFIMVALREVQTGRVEALLYFTFAAFFIIVHFILIGGNYNLGPGGGFTTDYNIESWLLEVLGPAIILLLLLLGGLNICQQYFSEAVIKFTIGLGMLGLLNEMGQLCPDPIKIFLLILACLTWFGLELRATPDN